MLGGRLSVGVALALSLGGQGCAHSSDSPPDQAGGAVSAGVGGALSSGGAPSTAGVGGSPPTGSSGGALSPAGSAGSSSNGGGGASGESGEAPPEGGGAPSAGGAGQAGGVTVSIDFAPSLAATNDTLVLTFDGPIHLKTESEPGNLLIFRTRSSCPRGASGPLGRAAFDLGVGTPVLLTKIAISQELDSRPSALQVLSQGTCITLRNPEGDWQQDLAFTSVSVAGNAARFEFTMPATRADAVAIYLPTSTGILNIAYTVLPP